MFDCVNFVGTSVWFAAGYEAHYCRWIALASVSVELLSRLAGKILHSDTVHLSLIILSYAADPFAGPNHGKAVVWARRGALQAMRQWDAVAKPLIQLMFGKGCQLVRTRSTVLYVITPI